jgi:hypothetical protein
MLIDSTYFQNSNIIANTNEPDPDSKMANVLSLMIARSEKEVLSFAFGVKMWRDFKPFIENGISDTTPEIYRDIIEGKDYVKDGKDCFWQGLIQEDTKESLLADYVYCVYHTENVTQTGEFGETILDAKVGRKVSSVPKITKVWNRFIEKLHDGVRSNPHGFTMEGKPYWNVRGGRDYYGVNAKYGEVSLVQFLLDNKEIYPLFDANYRRFGEFQNEFGI